MTWSLSQLLADLHADIQGKLQVSRKSMGHSGAKGAATERVWLELLETYLPQRYRAASAFVVDSEGHFSDQIDIVVFDRQYSPFIFRFQEQIIIPAESVYAVFEAKQAINAEQIAYAADKAASVRKLYRTSLPIPHAGGTYPPKKPLPIIGGLLTFESDWSPPMGETMHLKLGETSGERQLDIGCVASHGIFLRQTDSSYELKHEAKPATAFLLELIAQLQSIATVPMIDVRAYARWLDA